MTIQRFFGQTRVFRSALKGPMSISLQIVHSSKFWYLLSFPFGIGMISSFSAVFYLPTNRQHISVFPAIKLLLEVCMSNSVHLQLNIYRTDRGSSQFVLNICQHTLSLGDCAGLFPYVSQTLLHFVKFAPSKLLLQFFLLNLLLSLHICQHVMFWTVFQIVLMK